MRKIIKVFLSCKQFAVTLWPRHCLGQGKVEFGNSFIWILSILMCMQSFNNIYHMIEDKRRFPYFHIFASALPWSEKSGIWQTYWLDLISIYQYTNNYRNIPNCLSAMTIFANWPRTDRRIHEVIIGQHFCGFFNTDLWRLWVGSIFLKVCRTTSNSIRTRRCLAYEWNHQFPMVDKMTIYIYRTSVSISPKRCRYNHFTTYMHLRTNLNWYMNYFSIYTH